MSVEREEFLRGMARWARQDRLETVRPALIKGRRAEAETDLSQVPVKQVYRLGSPDGYAFVPGFSIPDGPDVVS